MTRDDQDWLAKQQADNRPPDHTGAIWILLMIAMVLLFWAAACSATVRLLEVTRG